MGNINLIHTIVVVEDGIKGDKRMKLCGTGQELHDRWEKLRDHAGLMPWLSSLRYEVREARKIYQEHIKKCVLCNSYKDNTDK